MEFVALDLTATGPDPARDAVIEIVCVRFVGNSPSSSLRSLIRPPRRPPASLLNVRGIPWPRLKDAPELDTVVPDMHAFLADDTVVAHNAPLHQAFLSQALRSCGLDAAYTWVDTLALSRAVWTELGDHTLAAARPRLGAAPDGVPGAPDDAVVTGMLFTAALRAAGTFPEGARRAVEMLLPTTARGWIVPTRPPAHPPSQRRAMPDSLESAFARLQTTPGWQVRPGQRAYAQAVATALVSGHTALLEAGAGTGKTYGYLVPLLLELQHSRARAVVTTRTRALQEQIVGKDLPHLGERLGSGVRTAVLKGRENYLCPRRLQEAQRQLHAPELMAPVLAWAGRTETGDLDELAALTAFPEGRRLVASLRDVPYLCAARACPWRRGCPSRQARERAREAQLVIANHALVASDVASGGSILGPYAWLVVDEAHAFARSVRDALSHRLSPATLPPLLGALRHGETGALARWEASASVDACVHAWGRVANAHRVFWSAVTSLLRGGTARYDAHFTRPIREEGDALRDELLGLSEALEDAAERLPDEEAELARGFTVEAARLAARVDELVAPPDDGRVFWFTHERVGPVLVGSPLELGGALQEALWSRLTASVLTSATLSADEEAGTLARELGLEGVHTVFARWPSPFPFSRVRAFVTAFLPKPDAPAYPKALAALVEELAMASGRRGLVLFTSGQMLDACLHHMQRVPTLAQGRDGQRDRLLQRFRNLPPPAVLLGLDTLWEGVDFPGDELELLVVARLPFPVPSDPLIEAESERLQASGLQPFRELFLPRAVLRLRQGVGRLVRKEEDRGIIVIADPRAATEPYGKVFLRVLPVEPRISGCTEDILTCLPEVFD